MSTYIYADKYMASTQAVADAIRVSTGQGEIVRIVANRSRDAVAEELFAECEDTTESGAETEYWGVDCDGAQWRVHLAN